MFKVSASLNHHFKGYCSSPCVIMLFVYMKGRFSLSYRDLEEMMSIREADIDHSTVQRWVSRFSHLIAHRVRRRKKRVNGSWRMDETYIKINGKWKYLYRAVDKYGDTIDFLLRSRRDTVAAKAFFSKAIKNNAWPEKVTIDKSGANTAALKSLNKGKSKEDKIAVRRIKYMNNIVEQDHRFIKKRTWPMLGFKNFHSAQKTIALIENIRIIQKGQIEGQNKNQNTFQNFADIMA